MITFLKTNSENVDFRKLVTELDSDLKIRDKDDHAFFAQFNTIDAIKYVIVAYENNIPVGCGAIKSFHDDIMEVKRMFVQPNQRGRGIASGVLKELENWAHELGATKCILETGKRQPEAIGLYTKSGYNRIPNYGQYKDVETSVCFEKNIGNL